MLGYLSLSQRDFSLQCRSLMPAKQVLGHWTTLTPPWKCSPSQKRLHLVPTLLNIGKRKEKRLAKTEIAEGAKEWTKISVSQLSCLEGSPVVLARKLSVFEGCYAPTVLHLQVRQEILGYEDNECFPHTLWLDPGNLTGAPCGWRKDKRWDWLGWVCSNRGHLLHSPKAQRVYYVQHKEELLATPYGRPLQESRRGLYTSGRGMCGPELSAHSLSIHTRTRGRLCHSHGSEAMASLTWPC